MGKVLDPVVLEKKLRSAAKAQDVRMLKRWLRKASYLRHHRLNTYAIHDAAVKGNKEIIDILIRFGCNLDYRLNGYTALSAAVLNTHEDVTELLVKTGIGINAQVPGSLNSALHDAARLSFRRGMKLLLEGGASVNQQNRVKGTPLHEAVVKGDVLCVKMLLEHKASTSIETEGGHTALQGAAARGFAQIVEMLLDHGAEVDAYNISDKPSLTALEYAIQYNKPLVTRLLLERGANVNLQTSLHGKIRPSPLHRAVENQIPEIVNILLEFKPDLDLRDHLNLTPLAIACSGSAGNMEIVQLLW